MDVIIGTDVQGKTRDELISIFDTKQSWSKGIVKHALGSIKNPNKLRPLLLKIGDICYHKGLNHPCLIIKVGPSHSIHILLTTEVTSHSLITKIKSRYQDWQESYVTSSMGISENMSLINNYLISIDTKQVLEIKKLLKLKYKGLWK